METFTTDLSITASACETESAPFSRIFLLLIGVKYYGYKTARTCNDGLKNGVLTAFKKRWASHLQLWRFQQRDVARSTSASHTEKTRLEMHGMRRTWFARWLSPPHRTRMVRVDALEAYRLFLSPSVLISNQLARCYSPSHSIKMLTCIEVRSLTCRDRILISLLLDMLTALIDI